MVERCGVVWCVGMVGWGASWAAAAGPVQQPRGLSPCCLQPRPAASVHACPPCPAGPRAALPRRRGLCPDRAQLWRAPHRRRLLRAVGARRGGGQPGTGVPRHAARQRPGGGHQGGPGAGVRSFLWGAGLRQPLGRALGLPLLARHCAHHPWPACRRAPRPAGAAPGRAGVGEPGPAPDAGRGGGAAAAARGQVGLGGHRRRLGGALPGGDGLRAGGGQHAAVQARCAGGGWGGGGRALASGAAGQQRRQVPLWPAARQLLARRACTRQPVLRPLTAPARSPPAPPHRPGLPAGRADPGGGGGGLLQRLPGAGLGGGRAPHRLERRRRAGAVRHAAVGLPDPAAGHGPAARRPAPRQPAAHHRRPHRHRERRWRAAGVGVGSRRPPPCAALQACSLCCWRQSWHGCWRPGHLRARPPARSPAAAPPSPAHRARLLAPRSWTTAW